MTGTGAGVMPIVSVVGQTIGDGVPGPITRGLVAQVEAAQEDPAYGLPIEATLEEVCAYLDGPGMLPAEMRRYENDESAFTTEYA
jgi:hypothetical protein